MGATLGPEAATDTRGWRRPAQSPPERQTVDLKGETTRLRIATWNVNSIRARLERLLRWLEREAVDILCLQELKASDEEFPALELQALGYHAAVFGQKTYNGVAILAREKPRDVERGFGPGTDHGDGQARLIAATVADVRVLCAYFPNGGDVGSEKWAYKLSWMRRLGAHLGRRYDPEQPLALCGDFNVAPEERDVYDPASWRNSVLFHPEVRAALDDVAAFGLEDVFRRHREEGGLYSWWDYRMLAFPKGRGLRIDHIYATRQLAGRSRDASIDREERKGKQPSDHAPVIASFAP
jgi:exodeoxyribonuclease III